MQVTNKKRNSFLLASMTFLGLALLISTFPRNDSTDFNVMIFLILLGVILISFFNVPNEIKGASMVLFVIKSLIVYFLVINNMAYPFSDSYNYIDNLETITNRGYYSFSQISSFVGSLHIGFYYFFLIPYSLMPHEITVMLINTLLITVSSILFYSTVVGFFSKKIAVFSFLAFGLSANVFIFGSFILKDALVVFLLSSSVYLYTRKRKTILAIMIASLLITVRIYSGFSVIIAIVLDLILFSSLTKVKKILSVTALSAVLFYAMNHTVLSYYYAMASGFVANISLLDIAKTLPTTLLKFFVSPLPWNVSSGEDIYSWLIFDSVIALMAFPFILVFLLKFLRDKEVFRNFFPYMIIIFIHAFALGIQYGGDSARQRSGILMFLILALFIGMFRHKKTS